MKTIKKYKKEILFAFILLFVIIPMYLNFVVFRPLKESKRNISTSDVSLQMDIKGDERSLIIRTYELEEYNNLTAKKKEKIKKLVNGNIEGDIPCLILEEPNNKIDLVFTKNGQEVKAEDVNVTITSESYYSLKNKKQEKNTINVEVTDQLEIQRNTAQYEKYHMEKNYLEIEYEIDGKEYISITAFNASNIKDGESFFENELLEEVKK